VEGVHTQVPVRRARHLERASSLIMKHILHVHQQDIKKGLPAIIDRTYQGSTHHTRLEIVCPCGCEEVAAVFVQSPTPDACGARVWIEARATRPVGDQSFDCPLTTTL
jgi:hypothetical protein